MSDEFQLPVTFNEEELSFPARMIRTAYGVKFEVDVNDIPVMFEPDEELNYRAIIDASSIEKERKLNIELLKEIAASLEFLVK